MCKVIKAFSEIKFPNTKHPVFPDRKSVFTFPTKIWGGKAINIVPDSCTAFGDIRLLPGITQELIEKQIKEKLESLGINNYKFIPIIYVPAVVVDKNEPLVQVLHQNATKTLGKSPVIEGSGPWSDMWMFVEKGIPAVNFGCRGKGLHAKDEYVEIDSVIEVTKIYALTAFDFLR